MDKLSVIGAGSWGCALALELADKGYDVSIFTLSASQADEINKEKKNEAFLPGVEFPDNIFVSTDMEEVVKDAKIIVMGVPSQQLRNALTNLKPFLKQEQVLVGVSKGIEIGTGLRMSQIAEEVVPDNTYVALTGPSHAEEVSRGIPTAVVVSSKDMKKAEMVRDYFMSPTFRVYLNNDLVGAELGGALKNIIAFGAGISDGIGYGDNAKAALMTRGISEISRLGVAMGADPNTFFGLTGVGDLIVTCTSMHSRNRRAGILLGQGKSMEETLEEVKMVVEGVVATEVAYEIAKKMGIEMPITTAIYNVIKGKVTPKDAVFNLMTRERQTEFEEIYELNKQR